MSSKMRISRADQGGLEEKRVWTDNI